LREKGLSLRQGASVDATIIHAPSSTKNKDGERDPEMHQTKKGNQYFFGEVKTADGYGRVVLLTRRTGRKTPSTPAAPGRFQQIALCAEKITTCGQPQLLLVQLTFT